MGLNRSDPTLNSATETDPLDAPVGLVLVEAPDGEVVARRVGLVLLRELPPALHGLHEDRVHDDPAADGAGIQPRDEDGVLVHGDGLDVRRGTGHCEGT